MKEQHILPIKKSTLFACFYSLPNEQKRQIKYIWVFYVVLVQAARCQRSRKLHEKLAYRILVFVTCSTFDIIELIVILTI